MKLFILVFLTVISYTFSVPLPSFMTACNLNDPNYKQCCLESGRNALKHIIKGNKNFKIPRLDPLDLEKLTLKTSNVQIDFRNIVVTGIANVKLDYIDIDRNHANIIVSIPRNEVIGNYNANGKAIILPFTGSGKSNFTTIDGTFNFTSDFQPYQKNGKTFNSYKNEKMEVDFKRLYMHFDNLFNGNKALGDELNKFLNDNWKIVMNDIGSSISQIIMAIFKNIAKNLIETVPVEEFFPE